MLADTALQINTRAMDTSRVAPTLRVRAANPSVTPVTALQAEDVTCGATYRDSTCKSLETKQTMGVCNETPGPG